MFSFKVGDLVKLSYKFNEHLGTIINIQNTDKLLMNDYPGSVVVNVLTNSGKIISCFSGDLLKISLNENKAL